MIGRELTTSPTTATPLVGQESRNGEEADQVPLDRPGPFRDGRTTGGSDTPSCNIEPEEWIGKHVRNTELSLWMDVDRHDLDATWILYRLACTQCAAYLSQLGAEFEDNPKSYVFVRLSEEDEEELSDFDFMPPGDEAILPASVEWVITPPWRLELRGGIITEAVFESGDG